MHCELLLGIWKDRIRNQLTEGRPLPPILILLQLSPRRR
jgi:hypothetical protein